MKFKFLVASAAIAATMLTACQNDVDFTQEDMQNAATKVDDNAIQFGTYLSNSGLTRAGATGMQNTEKLKTNGFGVFAYYTQKKTYDQFQQNTYTDAATGSDQIANFMYNQKVYYNEAVNTTTDGNITGWTYEPLKYWPNEPSASGKVDDLADGATTEYTNAGNVSFFAYAPWVELKEAEDIAVDKGGIIAVNDTRKLKETDKGNDWKGDPIITYQIPVDNKGFVDLLWGTMMKGATSENVVGDPTPGVLGTSESSFPVANVNYKDAVLKNFWMNADLSKQKTSGTVGFLFKHALGILGGSHNIANEPTDKDYQWGFQVVLDNDLNGAIQGGKKGKETVVTIEYIRVAAKSRILEDRVGSDGIPEEYYVNSNTADFNLATGKWDVDYGLSGDPAPTPAKRRVYGNTASEAAVQYQYIVPVGANPVDWNSAPEDKFYLNATIAEPTSGVTAVHKGTDEKTGYLNTETELVGVLNTPKNVYKTDGEYDPLVFFPGTYPELEVTVKYVVRTADANLSKGWSEVVQEITKQVKFEEPVALNKKYNLLMHIGLTSVKFTAQVDNWDDLNQGNRDSDGTGSGDAVRITDDIYMPKNVGGGSMNDGITENITIPYTDDAISVAVSGLVPNTQYTISGNGKEKVVISIPTPATAYETSGGTFTTINNSKPVNQIISLANLPQSTTDQDFSITITGPYYDNNGDVQTGGTKVFTITKAKAPILLTPRYTIINADVANDWVLNIDATTPNRKTPVTCTTGNVVSVPSATAPSVTWTSSTITATNFAQNQTSKNITYTFTAEDGNSEGSVEVVQKAAAMTLSATDNGGSTIDDGTTNKLAADKSIIKITVAGFTPAETLTSSNTTVSFTKSGGADLASLSSISYSGSTISFEVNHNTGASEDRTMVFTVKVNDAEQKITIVQAH